MKIFLVQHGQAMDASEDPLRPLSVEGVTSVRRVAAWAHDAAIDVTHIRHSGKLRAEQTAQILSDQLRPVGGLVSTPGLAPNDDVVAIGELLANEWAGSMLVGHLPFLNRLTGLLLAGDPALQLIQFHNGGIVCLLNEDGAWSIDWVTIPEVLIPW